ncbi:lipoprotein signal peptidase [Streptacidiphilus sp. MAP12-33]|uniref:hypothetical protein n=1 Tax=Streptacidiphilus sp. MAP12-33 TaxID=3156266 RepID=UPI0035148BB6
MSGTVRSKATATPAPPPAPTAGKITAGVITALISMVLCAAAYAGVIATTRTVYGWIGLIIGGAIGSAVHRRGCGGAVTSTVSAVCSLAATFLGQYVGFTLLAAHDLGLDPVDILLHHSGAALTLWQDQLGFVNLMGLVLAPVLGAVFPNIGDTPKRL